MLARAKMYVLISLNESEIKLEFIVLIYWIVNKLCLFNEIFSDIFELSFFDNPDNENLISFSLKLKNEVQIMYFI